MATCLGKSREFATSICDLFYFNCSHAETLWLMYILTVHCCTQVVGLYHDNKQCLELTRKRDITAEVPKANKSLSLAPCKRFC